MSLFKSKTDKQLARVWASGAASFVLSLVLSPFAQADVFPHHDVYTQWIPDAVTQLEAFEYFKDTECIRVTPSEHFVSSKLWIDGGAKERLHAFKNNWDPKTMDQDDFAKIEICDTYQELKDLPIDQLQYKDICTGICKPLLPEFDQPYYLNVSDIREWSINDANTATWALGLTDLAIGIGLLNGDGKTTQELQKQTESLQGEIKKNGRIKSWAGKKLKGLVNGTISISKLIVGFLIFDEAIRFGKKWVPELDRNYWLAVQDVTKPAYFNSEDLIVGVDLMQKVSEVQCQAICDSETFKEQTIIPYIRKTVNKDEVPLEEVLTSEGPVSYSRSYEDYVRSSPVVNKEVNRCQNICISTCQTQEKNDKGNMVKFKNKFYRYHGSDMSPHQKALEYLQYQFDEEAYADLEPDFGDQCIDFPIYPQLSIPEIAMLWANQVRDAKPASEREAVYPSALFQKVQKQDPSLKSFDQWEPLIPGYPDHLLLPYDQSSSSGAGGMVVRETKPRAILPIQSLKGLKSNANCRDSCDN